MTNFIKLFARTALAGVLIAQSYAANTVYSGQLVQLYSDPSDIVFRLSTNNDCGNNYYYLKRTNTNFDQMYALLLSAGVSGKTVRIEVSGCVSGKAIVSHGSIIF